MKIMVYYLHDILRIIALRSWPLNNKAGTTKEPNHNNPNGPKARLSQNLLAYRLRSPGSRARWGGLRSGGSKLCWFSAFHSPFSCFSSFLFFHLIIFFSVVSPRQITFSVPVLFQISPVFQTKSIATQNVNQSVGQQTTSLRPTHSCHQGLSGSKCWWTSTSRDRSRYQRGQFTIQDCSVVLIDPQRNLESLQPQSWHTGQWTWERHAYANP